MSVFDLSKATVVFAAIAFVAYSYPIVLQVAVIGLLGLLWLSYAHKTIRGIWE
jgi:hypothetical protein